MIISMIVTALAQHISTTDVSACFHYVLELQVSFFACLTAPLILQS